MENNDLTMTDASQIIGFEDPEINIPLPKPLSKRLMKGLNLIDDRFPKPIPQYFRKWYNHDRLKEKVPAERSYARELLEFKGSVEVLCDGGLSLWWLPSKNTVNYEITAWRGRKNTVVGTSDDLWYEVKGYGGILKAYHKMSKRILPPVPVLDSGNITFQMFTTMLATCPMPNDIQPDLADFNALQAAQFRCGPTLSKKRFRLLVYSCVDHFATLTINSPIVRVNLLSILVMLEARRKAAVFSDKKDAEKPMVSQSEGIEVHNKDLLPNQNGTKEDGNEIDPKDFSSTVVEEDGTKKAFSGKEVNPDDDDFQGRILLAEAVRERYLDGGVFEKQEKYIEHLWDHRSCPERWPFKINSRQENAINQISRAARRFIRGPVFPKWRFYGISSEVFEEDKVQNGKAKRLIRLLFEEGCSSHVNGVNQIATRYEPIEIDVKRGNDDDCPRDFQTRVFGAIKEFLLNPIVANAGRPRERYVGDHVDGDVDESYDAVTRLRVIDGLGICLICGPY